MCNYVTGDYEFCALSDKEEGKDNAGNPTIVTPSTFTGRTKKYNYTVWDVSSVTEYIENTQFSGTPNIHENYTAGSGKFTYENWELVFADSYTTSDVGYLPAGNCVSRWGDFYCADWPTWSNRYRTLVLEYVL